MLAKAGSRHVIRGLLLALTMIAAIFSLPVSSSTDQAFVMRLEGAIGPASASYITAGLEQARQSDAKLVVLAMDTPGGLDTSMREIIQEILVSFPLLCGPDSVLGFGLKEEWNGAEAQAGRDHR